MRFPAHILLFTLLFCAAKLDAQTDSLLLSAENTALADTLRVQSYLQIAKGVSKSDSTKAFTTFSLAEEVLTKGKSSAEIKEQWMCRICSAKCEWMVGADRADSACKLYSIGFAKVKSPINKAYLAQAYVDAGYSVIKKGKYLDGIEFNTAAATIFLELKDSVGLGQAYNNIGFMYQQIGLSDLALENYYRSLNIRTAIQDYSGIGESYNNLSFEFFNIGELDTALRYIDLAIEYRTKSGNQSGIAMAVNSKGFYLQNGKRYDEAMLCFRQCDAIWIGVNGIGNARVVYNLGFINNIQGHKDSAYFYFNKALDISRKAKDGFSEIYILNGLAGLALEEGKTDLALEYATTAYGLAQKLGSIFELKGACAHLITAYKAKNNFEQALFFTGEYYKYRDSLNTKSKQKQIFQQEAKFRFEQNMLSAKKEQELKDAVAESQSNRQKLIIVFSIAGFILVAVFSIFLFNRFRITRQQKNTIELQKADVEEKKHMLEEKQREIVDSINYAKRLQDAILPPHSLVKRLLPSSFVLYLPKDIVAGDFYWMEKTDDHVFFAVADCTGHGVPGAMVSVVCSNALNRAVKEFGLRETGLILDKVRELVIETFEKSESYVMDGMDISLAKFTHGKSEIQWSGANNPLWIISNDVLVEVKADKQPIGQSEHPKPFTSHSISLDGVSMLYLFTDGYADQFGGEKGKKFRYKQLEQLLLDTHKLPMEEQRGILQQRITAWRGDLEQVDDICVAGVRI